MIVQAVIRKLQKKIDIYNRKGDDSVKPETKHRYYRMADFIKYKVANLQLKMEE